MISGYLIKHPNAVKQHVFDFSSDIPENDFIGDYTITIVNAAGDDVIATDEVSYQADINTNDITVEFSGGIDGENYLVTVQISLDTSTTTPVRIVEMRVRSKDV